MVPILVVHNAFISMINSLHFISFCFPVLKFYAEDYVQGNKLFMLILMQGHKYIFTSITLLLVIYHLLFTTYVLFGDLLAKNIEFVIGYM